MATNKELQELLQQFKLVNDSIASIMRAIPEGLSEALKKLAEDTQQLEQQRQAEEQRRVEQSLSVEQVSQDMAEKEVAQQQVMQNLEQLKNGVIDEQTQVQVLNASQDSQPAADFTQQCDDLLKQIDITQQLYQLQKVGKKVETGQVQRQAESKGQERAAQQGLDPEHVASGQAEAAEMRQAMKEQASMQPARPSPPAAGPAEPEEERKLEDKREAGEQKKELESEQLKKKENEDLDRKKGTFASPFTPPSPSDGPPPPGGGSTGSGGE